MRTPYLVPLGVFSLLLACDSASDGSQAADSGNATDSVSGDEDGEDGDDATAESPDDSAASQGDASLPEEGRYTVRGRAELALPSAATSPRTVGHGPTPIAGEESEEWACDVEPELPPCEVCLARESLDEDCSAAWDDYCSELPNDPWCESDSEGEPNEVFAPTSLSLQIHKVEFSLDAEGCSDPILVAEADIPQYVNFADGPELFDSSPPPAGVYPCVIITISDQIQWSVDGDNPCAGTHTQDVYGTEAEEIVRLYISTAGSTEDDEGGPFEAPGILLEGALETGPGVDGSTFVVGFPEGVELSTEDGVAECDAQKPSFGFETIYE